jgi:hypothetical protein
MANQAVSGCNILILPVDASRFTTVPAGLPKAETALFCRVRRAAATSPPKIDGRPAGTATE